MHQSDFKIIQAFALRLLARREYTRAQLKQKLLLRLFSANLIEIVLDHMEEKGWQSDMRFAENYFRVCVERGDGILKIQMKMHQKGLTQAIIQQILPTDNAFWQQQLNKKWQKKLQMAGSDIKSRAKLLRFLQSRGFTLEQIYSVVKQVLD